MPTIREHRRRSKRNRSAAPATRSVDRRFNADYASSLEQGADITVTQALRILPEFWKPSPKKGPKPVNIPRTQAEADAMIGQPNRRNSKHIGPRTYLKGRKRQYGPATLIVCGHRVVFPDSNV